MFSRIKEAVDRAYLRVMPAFWLRMKPRYQWAWGIAAIVVVWISSGFLTGTSHDEGPDDASARTQDSVPLVRVSILDAMNRNATVTVRGQTQALHAVEVRTQVEGVVQALHFEKGDKIKQGDVLCEIRVDDRAAKVDQARALVNQTAKQHEVNLALAKEGFRSKTQVAQTAAALEAARAQARTMEIQLSDTKIRAPFDGFADDRFVDVGDYMRPGDKCALLIAPEPFLAVGMVTEQEVGQIEQGDSARVDLVTGQHVEGKVRFVASQADPITRAFRVEVEVPNPQNLLRAGVSADIHIPVKKLKAQKISPAILVLDDSGVVGVRLVKDGIVHFVAVHVISDGPDGMWISGLPDRAEVITVGQQFVSEGEHVKTVLDSGRGAS